ncbi:MAG TPA: CoA transferase, partial [Novosphingobium sp.]|nr:CoA transferase [Novosphingobium sp.]
LVPVNTAADVMANPQYAHRGYFAEVPDPVLGRLTLPTVPYRMSATPAARPAPAPLLGQDSAELLAAQGEGA